MTAAVVTSFIPIPDHPRSFEEYARLGQLLLNIDALVFDLEMDMQYCWLWEYMSKRYPDGKGFTHSVSDNPTKNSIFYHIVMAEKTELLTAALKIDKTSDVFIWIDYGICRLPGVTPDVIKAFVQRAANEKVIVVPGCWDKGYVYDDQHPCWRFCGGVMIVPREYVATFHAAMRDEYIRWLDLTGNISWEVNTLARLEKRDTSLPIWWYGPCDHDASMFTLYKHTEMAS